MNQRPAATKRGRRKRNTPPQIVAAIEEAGARGLKSPAIEVELQLDGRFESSELPSGRTIRDILSELAALESAPWTLADEDDAETPFLLDVLREVYRMSKGGRRHLTSTEAEMLKRIGRAAPCIPPYQAFLLARSYLLRQVREETTADLDAFLAFRPFSGKTGVVEEYSRAVEDGWFADFYGPMVRDLLNRRGPEWSGEGSDQEEVNDDQ